MSHSWDEVVGSASKCRGDGVLKIVLEGSFGDVVLVGIKICH